MITISKKYVSNKKYLNFILPRFFILKTEKKLNRSSLSLSSSLNFILLSVVYLNQHTYTHRTIKKKYPTQVIKHKTPSRQYIQPALELTLHCKNIHQPAKIKRFLVIFEFQSRHCLELVILFLFFIF